MAETIRDVIIRIRLQQVESKIEPPDLGDFKQQLEGTTASAKTASSALTDTASATMEVQQAATQASSSLEQLQREATEAKTAFVDANFATAESAKRAGEGAFQIARGAALAFASSEESAAAMLATVAKAQAAFDIFKGGTDLIIGSAQAYRAFTAATALATTAASAQAVAQTAVGTTAVTAAAGVTTLQVALGPVGIAVAVVSAVVIAAAAAWLLFSRNQNTAADSMPDVTEGLREQADELQRQIDLQNELDGINQSALQQQLKLVDLGKQRELLLAARAKIERPQVEAATAENLRAKELSILDEEVAKRKKRLAGELKPQESIFFESVEPQEAATVRQELEDIETQRIEVFEAGEAEANTINEQRKRDLAAIIGLEQQLFDNQKQTGELKLQGIVQSQIELRQARDKFELAAKATAEFRNRALSPEEVRRGRGPGGGEVFQRDERNARRNLEAVREELGTNAELQQELDTKQAAIVASANEFSGKHLERVELQRQLLGAFVRSSKATDDEIADMRRSLEQLEEANR